MARPPPSGPRPLPSASPERANSNNTSPLRCRAEVHRRIQSDVPITLRIPRTTVEAESRFSTPVLSEDESAAAYQTHYFPPLNIRKNEDIPRKPVPETPERNFLEGNLLLETPPALSFSSSELRKTPILRKPINSSPSPQLLTEVAEEDIIRRTSNPYIPQRYSSLQGSKSGHKHAQSLGKLEDLPEVETPSRSSSFPERPIGRSRDLSPEQYTPSKSGTVTSTQSRRVSTEATKLSRSKTPSRNSKSSLRRAPSISSSAAKPKKKSPVETLDTTRDLSIDVVSGKRSPSETVTSPRDIRSWRQDRKGKPISLFNLEPLSFEKVAAADSGSDSETGSIEEGFLSGSTQPKTGEEALEEGFLSDQSIEPLTVPLQPAVKKLDATRNPRPNSLYNPSLFDTQHGIEANRAPQSFRASTPSPKRKPVGTAAVQVTFAITEASPKDSSHQSLAHRVSNNFGKPIPKTTTKALPSFKLAPITPQPAYLGPHSPRITASFLQALETTSERNDHALAAARNLRRSVSIARIKKHYPEVSIYDPEADSPTRLADHQRLNSWISHLSSTAVPLPSTPGLPGLITPKVTKSVTFTMPSSVSDRSGQRSRYDDRDRELSPDSRSLDTSGNSEDNGKKVQVTPSEELTVMIDDLLNDLSGKFNAVTSEIMAKMDDMGRRIDNLEASLSSDVVAGDGEEHDHDVKGETERR